MAEQQVIGTERAIRRIRDLHRAVIGVVASSETADFLLARVLARFDAGVDPANRPWPGLAETTVRSKKTKGYPKPNQPLFARGDLRAAIGVIRGSSAGLLAGATGAGFRIGVRTPREAVIGRYHNNGIGQEKRQFIGVGPLDARALSGFFNRKLKSIAKG
jgi:hypothetical protein